jgi:hypothetical protein
MNITFCNDKVIKIKFAEDLYIKIKKYGSGISQVFCTDENNIIRQLPSEFYIIDVKNENTKIKKIDNKYMFLCFRDNYEFYHRFILMAEFINNIQNWNIKSNCEMIYE